MSSEQQPGRRRRPQLRELRQRLRSSELGGLAHDTGFVAVWQASVAAAGLAQIALVTRAFGIDGYGRLAVVIAFVDLVGGCFNLRVGYAATTFGTRWLLRDPRVAVGVFQYSTLIDLGSVLVALPLLVVLAFAIGPSAAGSGSTLLIIVFAFSLIGPVLSRTSFVVLRLLDRFALIATYQWALEFGRLALVVVAIEFFGSILAVIVAITVATMITGAVNIIVTARVFRTTHGLSLSRSQLGTLDGVERTAMRRTMFHTLVIQYGRVVQTQLPTVLLGALAGTTQAGIYKVGTASVAIIGKLIQPASNALLPRMSRLWAAGRIFDLRKLVSRASAISAVAMTVAFAAIVIFQDPILRFIGGGPEGEAAGTVLILGTASQALYGLVFWHSTILFAAQRTGAMSAVSATAAVVHILAMLALVPLLQATGAAIALLLSQGVITISWSLLALRAIRSATDTSAGDQPAVPATLG